MKDHKIGDLVKATNSLNLPVKKGSIGLIVEVKESVIDGISYVVKFESASFLMFHNELELL